MNLSARDNVAVTGSIIGIFSLFTGWFVLRSNRIANGTVIILASDTFWYILIPLVLLWITAIILSFLLSNKRRIVSLGILANVIAIATFLVSGFAADRLLSLQSDLARVSLSSGFWLSIVGAYTIVFATRQRMGKSFAWRNVISWLSFPLIVIIFATGWLNNLSVIKEFNSQEPRFIQEMINHVYLFGGSVLIGIIIGVPLGIWSARSKHAEKPVLYTTGILQTMPSLALFGLLIAPLTALSIAYPPLKSIGISGIGTAPAIIALIIYSLLPIVRNTFIGIKEIDPAVLDAGYGMGMSGIQVLRRIELPLSRHLVLEGIRTASVQAVGNTAVAALIGAGGLGFFIFQGLGQAASDLILLGAIPIVILALIVDLLMQIIIRITMPKGLSGGGK